MALTTEQIQQQRQQAEELLFSGKQELGFVKGLYFGQFNAKLLFPYPTLTPEQNAEAERAASEVKRFCDVYIDAIAIDRNAEIPDSVVEGLGKLGVLGMTAPKEVGGRGFTQQMFAKVMEVIGGHCSSTSVFVNAHHSIGIRALLLFGTEEQKAKWLPGLMVGKQLAAFALTEPQAGSDASNVQTTAVPTADGSGYILNGEKRWITNGGIAQVLTVIARTPNVGSDKKKQISAFLVTPDMPGFQVLEKRMAKGSIRGTATGRMAFKDMFVPKENILGSLGKGLRIALTVLDFGRTTFGATCIGVARRCVEMATHYAQQRVQFEQPIAEFELVKKKLAWMAAQTFAMEATTNQCAAFIDRGFEDYMLETAILKVFATEALWQIIYDTMQIHGGKSFFLDMPLERFMRDARLNQIGEGSNDVLKPFIAMVGIKPVADSLISVKEAFSSPFMNIGTLLGFGARQITARLTSTDVPVKSSKLVKCARDLGRRVREFSLAVQGQLFKHREQILFREYAQERIAEAACELYASSCVLSRLESILQRPGQSEEDARDVQIGKYYLRLADRKIRQNLAALTDNDDATTTATADAVLARYKV
jgi:alkylation response protein AidB-like acyl-CoA dehydrogenase